MNERIEGIVSVCRCKQNGRTQGMLECNSAPAIGAALKGPKVSALQTLMGGALHIYPS